MKWASCMFNYKSSCKLQLLKTVGVLFFCFVTINVRADTSVEQRIYTVGIVPQHAASKIVKKWTPLLNKVNQLTGYSFKVKTSKNIPEFENKLAASVYDFAYMNPYHFVVYNEKPGYIALNRQTGKKIHGILVAHRDSPISTINELSGNQLAFPSPGAFAASILTRGSLIKENIKFDSTYVSSHDSVYKTVSKKIFVAGGGVMRTLNNMDEETRNQLKVLWKSPGYTPHAIAVHHRVPEYIRVSFQQALTKLATDEEGKEILRKLSMKGGFSIANDKDWDDVRSLKVSILNSNKEL